MAALELSTPCLLGPHVLTQTETSPHQLLLDEEGKQLAVWPVLASVVPILRGHVLFLSAMLSVSERTSLEGTMSSLSKKLSRNRALSKRDRGAKQCHTSFFFGRT